MVQKKNSTFDGVHLQWFGDRVPNESLAEDPEIPVESNGDDDEVEFQIVDREEDLNPPEPREEDEDDEVVKLTKEQLDQLQNNQSVNQTMVQTLSQISEAINKKQSASGDQLPTQQPGESDEDFEKRFNDEVFKDNPAHAVKEMIQRVVNPYLGQFGAITAKQAKSLMEVHPEKGDNFRRFKKDIEEFVENLPPQQRNNPSVWEYAYNEVMKTKQPEIVEDIVERKVQERLQEMGVSSDGQKKKAPQPQHMEGMSQSAPVKGKKVVRLTRAQEQDRIDSGMTREDYVRFVLKKEL